MRITVRVKTKAGKTEVISTREGEYEVRVGAEPRDGKANAATIEALAEHFGVKKSQVLIVSGEKNRYKQVVIK